PLTLTLNINEIRSQMESVSTQAKELGTTLGSSLNGIGDSSGSFDKVVTTLKGVDGQLGTIRQTVSTVNDGMGQIVQTTEKFVTVSKEGVTTEEQLGQTVTKTSDLYKQQADIKQKSIDTNENALVQRENEMVTETNNLLKQQADLTKAITIADDKNLMLKSQELTAQKEIVTANLEASKAGLGNISNVGQSSVSATETILADKQNVLEAEINDKMMQQNATLREQADLRNQNTTGSNSLLTSMGKMIPMMAGMAVVMGVISGIKSGISDIVTMDSTLATLAITMHTTNAGLQDMKNQINDVSIATGSNTTDVENAVKVYANYGETVTTVMAKAHAAIELANVTGLDTTATTDSIHAIINEFGLAGQNAEATSTHISDSLVAISKNMAMDFGILKCAV
ncbi:MAG TPA: phage tail tape measure protein, partial [Clostridium sp.]